MERDRIVSSGSKYPLMGPDPGYSINEPTGDERSYNEHNDSENGHHEGDLSMQHVDTSYSHTPTLLSPEITESKGGRYASLNSPSSTFDVEDEPYQHRHHVKRFDHNLARKKLLKTGASKLFVTIFFSAAICIALKAWEGFRTPVVLSKIDVRIFNAVLIGLSLCLGLNILSSLKQYAATFRWSFLTRRYVSLEVFDLILHLSSLAKVTKLMIISSPGFRGRNFLRRFRMFRDVRDDGTKWMWLACLMWLSINIGSQILVALLSLFWPMSNSEVPLLTHGNVTTANLNAWVVDDNLPPETDSLVNETSLEAAWMYGMEAMVYPEFSYDDVQKDLSKLPGTPLYQGTGNYSYRFFNRDPTHQYTNYIVSSREVSTTTVCEQLEVHGNGSVSETENGAVYLNASRPGHKQEEQYFLPEQASGAVTWVASIWEHCGPRCTNFTVLQYGFDDRVNKTSLFLCNSTLNAISKATANDDIAMLNDQDAAAVYGSDEFARIAAGAIGWTGIPWNGWDDRQARSYSQGSKWSPAKIVTKQEVERMLMRFTIGAVASFDDHGIRYNVTNQRVMPVQGQQLDVDWPWVFGILGGICGIQFFALVLLVIFANRTIVRDDSYFSMAMLLSGVVSRIGKAGMNMSGEDIKEHPRLKWKKIRYDYREGKNGDPNQVDIFFEGKDQKEGRKSWAAGSYS